MAYTANINETAPLDTDQLEDGAAEIRATRLAMKERLASIFVDPNADPLVLKDSVVATANVADAAITTAKIADGAVTIAKMLVANGALPGDWLPAVLPAISGANLTNLNASNVASGTLSAARLPAAMGAKSFTSLAVTDGGSFAFSQISGTLNLLGFEAGYVAGAGGFPGPDFSFACPISSPSIGWIRCLGPGSVPAYIPYIY